MPTRRSSRSLPAAVPAPAETPGSSRAEIRRRSAEAAVARPSLVWGRPATPAADTVAGDAADTVAIDTVSIDTFAIDSVAIDTFAIDTFAIDTVSIDTVAIDSANIPVILPETVTTDAATTALIDSVQAETTQTDTAAPLTRRGRRVSVESTTAPDAVAAQPETVTSVDADIPTPSPDAAVAADAVIGSPSSTGAASPAKAMSDTIADDALQTATTPFELLEPEFAPDAEPLPDAATTTFPAAASRDAADDSPTSGADFVVDEFERAARLFSFTGETPIQNIVDPEPVPVAAADSVGRGTGKRRGAGFARMATASFSVGVMGLVGMLAVGMTTPAAAVAAANGTIAPASVVAPAGDVARSADSIQAYVAPAQVQNVAIQRNDSFETGTLVQMAGAVGITQPSSAVFSNNPNCPIQWPFAVGVGMSYGFGMRDGVMHEGIDFTPGDGAHIQAIDHGVVRVSTDSGGNYGVTIVIDHIVDGQLVSSRYGHMQYGSRQVQVGDTVEVGEYIGRTGDTGYSFGSHTHFEILAGGTTAIDPLPWLQKHAQC